jgi:hypothetical protein
MADLTPLQQEYLLWLIDPEHKGTKLSWATDHKVSYETLRRWQKSVGFRDELERTASSLNVSTERIQDIVNALWKKAVSGDVKASELYLRYAEKLQPPRVVIEDRRVAELSDAELHAELIAAQQGLRAV